MRKLVVSISLAAATVLGLDAGIAQPGPNGKNNHGLCTAYFNGSQRGMDNKRNAPPFENLAKAAADADEDGTPGTPADVWKWCNTSANNPKGVGGNPTNPTDPNSTAPGGGSGSGQASSNKGGKKK